jgi:hypothetical protein
MICSNSQYHGDEPEIEAEEQRLKEYYDEETEK